jgi:hypothetical protein
MAQPLPRRSRPQIQKDYGVPEAEEGMLEWSFVEEQMAVARNFWVCTVRPDGRPHAMPVWGIWLDGVFYHGGGTETRRARNLARNPDVVVHLESGDHVVIMEGATEIITDPVVGARLDEHYIARYGMPHGLPLWALQPRVVFAWTDYPVTATRWVFEPGT